MATGMSRRTHICHLMRERTKGGRLDEFVLGSAVAHDRRVTGPDREHDSPDVESYCL